MAKRKAALVAARKPRDRKRVESAGKSPSRQANATPSIYSVHPGVAMVQKWIADLPAQTGRTFEGWTAYIRTHGPDTEKEARLWLKEQYNFGTNMAWWLAAGAFGNSMGLAESSPESYLKSAPQYVERMYAGPKAPLRPIHDELIALARKLGDDVRICPCKTIVPLYRRHVFAEIKPAANKRIDLGLALGDEPFTSRLLDTGGRAKKNRITHRVALASPAEIDLQVKRWLREAYQRDA
jgi:hypothetical protein